MDTNASGVFFGIRAALPALKRAGGGSIINTSSNVARMGSAGIFAYQASKSAIEGMTRAAAAHYGEAGIRVNAIAPGLIYTPMVDDVVAAFPDYDPDRDELPLQVLDIKAKGDHISAAVLYLASDESAFHTGDLITIDGGAGIGLY
jgi:3alpha(or 20beta)-hydroxysteroid dehydrogenase